jgi:hypothetical protein
MHLPASALPGAPALLLDPASQQIGQLAFAPRPGGNPFPPSPAFEGAFVAAPAFANGWSNLGGGFQTAVYYKDRAGLVRLAGVITAGTIPATAFTLPVGFRPALIELFIGVSGAATSRIDVQNDGQVIIRNGTNGFVSLSGICFRAA